MNEAQSRRDRRETECREARSIVVDEVMPHSADKVWRMLTQAEALAQWLMPNDFQLALGHRFTFRTKPMGDWDGVVQCEVLEIRPLQLLRYSWIGGADSNSAYGSKLVSTVTWTLTAVDGGTRVRMAHEGFGPHNNYAYDAMSGGWGRILKHIDQLITEGK
jgi:uncharacterized protein YndB with AHSA1/START domain